MKESKERGEIASRGREEDQGVVGRKGRKEKMKGKEEEVCQDLRK